MRRAVCGTTALVLGLGSAAVLCEAAAHRVRPSAEHVASAVAGGPEAIVPPRLAGQWRRDKDASKLIVTRRGEVWSDSGAMQGSARGHAGADFAFGNGTFLCAYRLNFAGADTADWQLVDHTPATACPEGHFTRAAAL